MESRLSRYIVLVVLVCSIGIAVNHYKGKWFNVPVLDELLAALDLTKPETAQPPVKLSPPVDRKPRYQERHENTLSAEQLATCDTLTVTQAKAIQKRDKGIYSWTDEQGVTHFSDAAAAEQHSQLTHYKEPEYSFELAISTKGTSTPPFLRNKLTSAIKQIDARYRQLLPKKVLQPIKIDLILASNKGVYKDLERQYTNFVSASQGFYSGQHNIAAVWYRTDEQAFSTALHESVHVMNAGQFGITPRWFNEGLAEYFESPLFLRTLASNSQHLLYTPLALKRAKERYRHGVVMTLPALLNATAQQWSGSRRNDLYSASHLFISFLMSSYTGRQTLAALFTDFSEQRCKTKQPIAALEKYRGGYAKLQQDWLKWQKR
ncbi:DUF4124 domain-containing protein [Shewanella waksmanii]|uniref:DUF4124 domain-containing protein n=1 Tax=Shewanella waksmanii TaxID=213783 RepID=UPI0004903E18|nr:DUF4124 domain-containing protein [Shewanella waksmanii]